MKLENTEVFTDMPYSINPRNKGKKAPSFHELTKPMKKALINLLSLYPVGQFVRLNNGMVGKVIKTCTENPVQPDIQIYFDSSGNRLEIP
ncbi:MAG: hypothetical protein ISS66_10350 [Desulfobacteraceae bacterium]|nr:hypothetical protein [Desulfobacteraceae bacterium]